MNKKYLSYIAIPLILGIFSHSCLSAAEWHHFNIEMMEGEYAPYLIHDGISYRRIEGTDCLIIVDLRDETGMDCSYYSFSNDKTVPSKINDGSIEYTVIGTDVNCFLRSKFHHLTLPESLEFIGPGSFAIPIVQDIVFGNKLRIIGKHSFFQCQDLKDIQLPNSLFMIEDYCFNNCEQETISFGTGLSRIGANCFQYNVNLVKLDLPEGLREMGKGCFQGCQSLETITIPQYLFFDGCFNECPAIKEIRIKHKTPYCYNNYNSEGLESFNKVDKKTCKVIVPKGCVETYRNDRFWKDFLIEEEGSVDVQPSPEESSNIGSTFYDINGLQLSSPEKLNNGTPYIRRSEKGAGEILIK